MSSPTPDQHRAKAEEILDRFERQAFTAAAAPLQLMAAQVHATLAGLPAEDDR